MKTKNNQTVRTVPNPTQGMVETESKSVNLTHIYMTGHSPGLVQALQ